MTLDLEQILNRKGVADSISQKWEAWKGNRSGQEGKWKELRDYIFATDTSTTSNSTLPWKNSTTIPKLCQIRDNLHANYMAALFPNDNHVKWEAYTAGDDTKEKRDAIQAYMSNKVRESQFRNTVSNLVYDFIDYGNPFADVIYCNERKKDPTTDEVIAGYIGPKAIRISPLDIVFDPTVADFTKAPKITRSVMTYGDAVMKANELPGSWYDTLANHVTDSRSRLTGMTKDDFDKASGYSIDGFGSLHDYYGSGYIELLEFEGTMYDIDTNTLYDDYVITVVDRTTVVRKEAIPAWKRGGFKVHAGWRKRPDNLYAMGPLENLVGMQYRLDHLQNLAADIRDLTAAPPLVIRGDVQDTVEWSPFAEFHMEVDGDVRPLFTGSDLAGVENEMASIIALMEEMAGAPKQAMGIRTPGEKTAHEVSTLENAASRIFQDKIRDFEINIVEPLLNNMLHMAVMNMNDSEVVRVMDDDLGVADFQTITKTDITAAGNLRAVGARHFAAQAQLVQNLTNMSNTPIWPKIEKHVGSKKLSKVFESILQLERFDLVSDNAGVMDDIETQRLMNQGEEDLEVERTPDEDVQI